MAQKVDVFIGRRRIDDTSRAFFSKRTFNGDMSVIRENFKCPKCSHHKAFRKHSGVFCTRCGMKTK